MTSAQGRFNCSQLSDNGCHFHLLSTMGLEPAQVLTDERLHVLKSRRLHFGRGEMLRFLRAPRQLIKNMNKILFDFKQYCFRLNSRTLIHGLKASNTAQLLQCSF